MLLRHGKKQKKQKHNAMRNTCILCICDLAENMLTCFNPQKTLLRPHKALLQTGLFIKVVFIFRLNSLQPAKGVSDCHNIVVLILMG